MKARGWYYILALAAVLAVAAAGCSRARSDSQVANEVQGKIFGDSNVPTKQIGVSSNNGVVTLSGNVGSDMERQAAANDAAQVEGVKTVVNNLMVAAPAAAEATPQPAAVPEPQPTRTYSHSRRTSPRVQSAPVSAAPSSSVPSAPAMASAPVSAPTAGPAPPPPPKPVTIDSGTVLQVRMIDAIDSDRNQPGDRFRATLDTPITLDDKVIVPQGADIEGRVAELKSAGHFAGRPEIALELTALSVNGRRYAIHTNQYAREGASRGKNTAAKVGTGAAVGSIIGAIAGGGKGAAIGGVIGAGAGGGVQAATKAQQVHVPSEALLTFTLQGPLTVTPVSSVHRSRSNQIADYSDNSQPSYSSNSNNSDNSSNSEPSYSNDNSDPNAPVLKRR